MGLRLFEEVVGDFASGRVSRGVLAFNFHLENFVCAFVGVDLGMSKECDEAFLEGAKAAFDFPLACGMPKRSKASRKWRMWAQVVSRVHFCFDRCYSATRRGEVLSTGAYSRPFRPDFSLVVFPAIHAEGCGPFEAEARAEKKGQLAYLHFDAKYRVDQLPEIFGPDDESVFSEEEAAKSTNTYKRADLYKMHAYNDAIRRMVGSYVLYPGNGPGDARFSKYHEILPGVGAFSISPGHADGRREIGRFVADVLERQRDRFTQLARINYWTHDTVREEPAEYHAGGRAGHAKPPKDASVVLGFLREGDDPEAYRMGGCFFAMRWSGKTRGICRRRSASRACRRAWDSIPCGRTGWLCSRKK